MEAFLQAHWLDMLTTVLGLAYILLEYKASIWLWAVGFAMQSLGIVLYYQKGLYADCGMEFYYLAMTVYGFLHWVRTPSKEWKTGKDDLKAQRPITHFPKRLAAVWLFITIIALKGAGIVIADESTLLGLGSFSSPEVVLCLVGFVVIARFLKETKGRALN